MIKLKEKAKRAKILENNLVQLQVIPAFCFVLHINNNYINENKMIYEQYIECIEACQKCATICNNCATACLNEKEIDKLSRCIQLNMECSILCRTAAEIMSMGGIYSDRQCSICVEICNECAEECIKHAENLEQCREYAENCKKCAELCANMSAVGVQ